MTMTMTEGHRLQPLTLMDPDRFVSLESLEQVTSLAALIGSPEVDRENATWILMTLLPSAFESAPDDPEGFEQARRALSLLLHHDLDRTYFDDAWTQCGNLHALRAGDMPHEGIYNTADNRTDWILIDTQELNMDIGSMVAGIPERVAA